MNLKRMVPWNEAHPLLWIGLEFGDVVNGCVYNNPLFNLLLREVGNAVE